MAYLIAGVLLGAAVAILTFPWSRRDQKDFTLAELGYAFRGPRGALAGALRTLVDLGVARPSRQQGVTHSDEPLPSGTDPFLRAVYGAISVPREPAELLDLPSVEKALAPVAARAITAGMRVGPARRAVGSLAALAAPVTALVALAHGGDLVLGIVVSVVALVVFGWLVSLRGVTIAGTRTLSGRRTQQTGTGGESSQLEAPIRVLVADLGAPSGGFGVPVSESGMGSD
jgi:uncharacterized protein (TIGR04222 family)